MTHIGQIIEKELHRQERSVTWFARRLIAIELMYIIYLEDRA